MLPQTTCYFYENWVAAGHRATIHLSLCSYCNGGKGIHPNAGTHNGQWQGPFRSVHEARAAAANTGAVVRLCRHCCPTEDR